MSCVKPGTLRSGDSMPQIKAVFVFVDWILHARKLLHVDVNRMFYTDMWQIGPVSFTF